MALRFPTCAEALRAVTIRRWITHHSQTEEALRDGYGHGDSARAAFIRHFTATHQIDLVDEASAVGRAYYQVLTDRGLDHWGRYVDEYRRVAGRWLIYSRKVTVDGAVPDSWASR